MPTGYTYFIEEGKITTGKEFLLLCSRAFEVAMSIKDEPLSVPTPVFEPPSEFYKKKSEQSEKELYRLCNLTLDEYRNERIAEQNKKVASAKERYQEYEIILERYNAVRREVAEWEPPTSEHKPIKTFALEQIDMCIDDVRHMQTYCTEDINRQIDTSDDATKHDLDMRIRYEEESLWRYTEQYENDVKRVNKRNDFMKQFIDSLQ